MFKIKPRSIGLREDQIEFIKENKDFDINKFTRDKLDEYMERKNEKIE